MWIHNKVAEVLMMVDTQPKHAFHSWVHIISQSGYVANVITYQPFKASTCLQIYKQDFLFNTYL